MKLFITLCRLSKIKPYEQSSEHASKFLMANDGLQTIRMLFGLHS